MSLMSPVGRLRARARLVAVAVAACVGLTGCSSIFDAPLPGGADVGKDPITVHVMFRDVLDLVPQTTVKVDDVTVGRVTTIQLKGYVADVTLKLPKNIDLPDNAVAEIRQTSLLGEKFVSLSAPTAGAEGKLGNGDLIPLSRTGRNPEVEEVLGALSLLLNGGGVAQLKTIVVELNNATDGRESDIRDVISQLESFTGQLDARKAQVVGAIDKLDRLARSLKAQDKTIRSTLDDLPSAIASVNTQRADLVKLLQSLSRLSNVGVKVIQASKESTVNTLSDLAPVLDKLAEAGDAFPKSLQVALTYPFVDEAVGRDPQVARNLHIGDYVNLDARLNINLNLLVNVCGAVGNALSLVDGLTGLSTAQQVAVLNTLLQQIGGVCQLTVQQVGNLLTPILKGLLGPGTVLDTVLQQLDKLLGVIGKLPVPSPQSAANPLTGSDGSAGTTSGGTGTSAAPGGTIAGILGNLFQPAGVNRAAPSVDPQQVLNGPLGNVDSIGYNSTLGSLLLQGVATK